DQKYGEKYLRELIKYHISGQLKIAPEHTENNVLEKMGKPDQGYLKRFRDKFLHINKEQKKKQFLTYYLIAAHSGCREEDMYRLKEYTSKELKLNPEQVQIFTPTPSTYSTLMYYTERDPFTGKAIYAEINSNFLLPTIFAHTSFPLLKIFDYYYYFQFVIFIKKYA
ncbi:unnamed protein product, partial [marine sediment metagenome]